MNSIYFRIFYFTMFFYSIHSSGQDYSIYSNDTLSINSIFLKTRIVLNLQVPETQPYSSGASKYPIAIVFDSQHDRTYPQIVGAFDLLTNESQIPESIIIGIPFTFQNRTYFTSATVKEGDSLSGIERLELFLFKEVIPLIKKNYDGGDFLLLFGHSRTVFLVNYLAFKNPDKTNVAASFSGFFENKPLSIQNFANFLTNPRNFKHRFQFYITSGTSLEEVNYLEECRELDQLLKNKSLPDKVNFNFIEQPYANHMTNFWVSIPTVLLDVFSSYNSILNNWFYGNLNYDSIVSPVDQLKQDLKLAGEEIDIVFNPSVTHIYSLASHYDYQRNDYKNAIRFFEYGIECFPEYLAFYVENILMANKYEDKTTAARYKKLLYKKLENSNKITEFERAELNSFLKEN